MLLRSTANRVQWGSGKLARSMSKTLSIGQEVKGHSADDYITKALLFYK